MNSDVERNSLVCLADPRLHLMITMMTSVWMLMLMHFCLWIQALLQCRGSKLHLLRLGWHKFHVLEPPNEDLRVERASEILPGLWLGSSAAVQDEAWLREAGIKAVVNAAGEIQPPPTRSVRRNIAHIISIVTCEKRLSKFLSNPLYPYRSFSISTFI